MAKSAPTSGRASRQPQPKPLSPPIKNGSNGKPSTPSGHGVVDRGRQESQANRNGTGNGSSPSTPAKRSTAPPARNGNGTRTSDRDLAPTSSPPEGWWKNAANASQMSDRDRKRMSATAHTLGDQYHRMAETLWTPEQNDLPATSRIQDQRLYQGGNGNGNGGKAPVKPAAKTPTKTPAKQSTAKGR